LYVSVSVIVEVVISGVPLNMANIHENGPHTTSLVTLR